MDLLPWIRKEIVLKLWSDYQSTQPQINQIISKLQDRKEKVIIDHLVIADIPGKNSGLQVLRSIFESLGFVKQGDGFNPETGNEFIWMSEGDSRKKNVDEALPQIIISSFRTKDLEFQIQKLLSKFSEQATTPPLEEITRLAHLSKNGDEAAAQELVTVVLKFLSERNYPQISSQEFEIINHQNDFIAWTLVHSRKPFSFALAGHCLKTFTSINELNDFIMSQCKIDLKVKKENSYTEGHQSLGLLQSETMPVRDIAQLSDSLFLVTSPRLQLIWRYPKMRSVNRPAHWGDYFTGFLNSNSNENQVDQTKGLHIVFR